MNKSKGVSTNAPLVSAQNVAAVAATTSELVETTLTVPTLEWKGGNLRRRVDLVLNREQAINLKSILLGLEYGEAQLANGKFVANVSDALRWMLENCPRKI